MKTLTEKTKSFLKKAATGALITAYSFLPQTNSNAQDVDSIYKNDPELQSYLNPYNQPNNHLKFEGKDSLEYYGSGDVNLDGIIDGSDANLIRNGISNDMSDVDGNGYTNESDAQMIDDYSNGVIDHLPAHWNDLTPKEKVSWLRKANKIDKSNTNPYNKPWVCENFTLQRVLDFRGLNNWQNSSDVRLGNQKGQYADSISRFNIPTYTVATRTRDGVGHAVTAVLVGDTTKGKYTEDPENFNDWYFWYPSYSCDTTNNCYSIDPDGRLHPGDGNFNEFAEIKSWSLTSAGETSPLIQFNFPNNNLDNLTPEYQYPQVEKYILLSNPNKPDSIPPTIADRSDYEVTYNEFFSYYGDKLITDSLPAVSDNWDKNPRTEYSYTQDSISPGNYNLNVTFSATDMAKNKTEKNWTVAVKDKSPPQFTTPSDVNVSLNDYNDRGINGIVMDNLPTDLVDNADPNPYFEWDWQSYRTDDGSYTDANFNNKIYLSAFDFNKNATGRAFFINVTDSTPPYGTLTSTYIEAQDSESNPETLAKSLLYDVWDNSGAPVDTILTQTSSSESTSGKSYMYNVKLKDVSNLERDLGGVEVYVPNTATAISKVSSNKEVGIAYPNPAKGTVKFSCNLAKPVQVEIFNANGQLINRISEPDRTGYFEYDFSSAQEGLYLIKIIDKKTNKVLSAQKIIIK